MATSREFMEHLFDCCAGMALRARPMMGEYVVYYREKVIGGAYDNCVMLKDVPAARALLPEAEAVPPYPGAKPMLPVDCLEDRARMEALLEAIYPELPAPKPRKRPVARAGGKGVAQGDRAEAKAAARAGKQVIGREASGPEVRAERGEGSRAKSAALDADGAGGGCAKDVARGPIESGKAFARPEDSGAGEPCAAEIEGAVARVRAALFEMADEKYRGFMAALVPTLPEERVVGVRVPRLRKFAKQLGNTPDAAAFLRALPHEYLEENHLHGFLIEGVRDYAACVAALDKFLPCVDNWATCDLTSPRALARDIPALRRQAELWMDSPHPYAVRFGIGVLMRHFLDENYDPACLARVAAVRSGEYYVRMMVAWYFATSLAKRYEDALEYIRARRLDDWTHNKAIQKAVESDRVSAAHKAELRKFKISARKST